MRPLQTGDGSFGGRPSARPDSFTAGPSTAPMACFITSESNIDNVRERSRPNLHQLPDRRKYPSRSRQRAPAPTPSNQWGSPTRAEGSISSFSEVGHDELLHDASRPDTPLLAGLSGPESAFSGSSSRRSSIAISSMEYQSSRHDMLAPSRQDNMDEAEGADQVPQLIMPSVVVPRRLPFSHVGRSLGKLKIMVAGPTGIGKTSLIRSLAQRCEHIVHIDPIAPTRSIHASETYASSRPQPWWRSDSDLSTPTGRRRSLVGGEMLDRNVCFVECPSVADISLPSSRELNYIESHLNNLLTKSINDSDLFALLNAGGEPIVDALLYLIPKEGPTSHDIEYIKGAQDLTNVIPILARADELNGSERVDAVKQQLNQKLADAGLDCFSFATPESLDDILHVYAVSTETLPDYETMDASILMNSNYMPDLVPTDLGQLVDHLFSLDGSARLRHAAANKCVRWRRDRCYGALQRTTQGRTIMPRPLTNLSFYSRHMVFDTAWERIDLHNWANNLRQSLQAERIQQMMLVSSDLSDTVTENRLVRVGSNDSISSSRDRRRPTPQHQDPLGLLEFGGRIKQKGLLALELLSSLGLLGYMITQLTQPDLPTQGALCGFMRVSIDVTGLGALSV